MSKKTLILAVLLVIAICTVMVFCFASAPTGGETAPPASGEQFATMPLPEDNVPAQPGEGPAGLPTPAL